MPDEPNRLSVELSVHSLRVMVSFKPLRVLSSGHLETESGKSILRSDLDAGTPDEHIVLCQSKNRKLRAIWPIKWSTIWVGPQATSISALHNPS